MNENPVHKEADASSRFQDSLPVSSDQILAQLERWKIDYVRYDHIPLNTVEESKRVQNQFSSSDEDGAHIKNLYLRDHKKRNFLVIAQQDHPIDLKQLKVLLGSGRLSFGSPDRLMEHLGVRPGAVTPLSMINGRTKQVDLFIDQNLQAYSKIYVHPLVNDRTLELPIEGLESFFGKIGVTPNWITI